MKNEETWQPSKILPSGDGWYSNEEFAGRRSEHVAKLECSAYVDILDRHVSGDLLDVGAGTVPYYGVYKDKTASVTCIDWGESLHDLRHMDLLVDVNLGLPFPSDQFDTVLLADVLEHIKNPQLVINECATVLRNSGKVIIFVPFMYWLHEQPNDYYRYTEHALRELVETSDLEVVELAEYGGGPDIFIDVAQKMFANETTAYDLMQGFWKSFIKTPTYAELRSKHGKKFPIGYSLVAQKI